MDEWIQPANKLTAYDIGAQVVHDGAVWESLVKENMVEPGTDDAAWALITPSLTDRALNAYNDEVTAWQDAARAALVAVIGEESMTVMEMVESQARENYHMAVWGDGVVHLATRRRQGEDWKVYLVAKVDGAWTTRSDALVDLADLGEALL